MSNSHSEKKTASTTKISTTNVTSVGGPALNNSTFVGDIGLTGKDAVAAIAAFNNGEAQIERARTKQIANVFSGLTSLANQVSAKPVSSLQPFSGGASAAKTASPIDINYIIAAVGGIAALSTILYLNKK